MQKYYNTASYFPEMHQSLIVTFEFFSFCCRQWYKVVNSYSLRYRLTLSSAAVMSELFQSVLAQLENLPSHGWNSISACHDTLHCVCFFMSYSIGAMCSLRFLPSQIQSLKPSIKSKLRLKCFDIKK